MGQGNELDYGKISNAYAQAESLSCKKLRLVDSFFEQGAVLADIGCGEGAWCKRALSKFDKVFGVDSSPLAKQIISKKMVDEDRFRFMGGVDDLLSEMGRASCDAVTILDVVEHVSSPSVLLDPAYQLLKTGGDLVVTMPNWYDFVWTRVLKKRSLHLAFHSSFGWARVLEQAGFSIQCIRTVDFPVIKSEFLSRRLHLFGMCVCIHAKK